MYIDQLQHLALVGRLTINLASLNNEGTEGNATQPRTAVVVRDGMLHTVPVISGDMVKHWHAVHLSAIAQERRLPLCKLAKGRALDPNRLKVELAEDEWVRQRVEGAESWKGKLKSEQTRTLEEAIYTMLAKECVVTDTHGLLITEVDTTKSSKNGFKASVAVPRTSRVQFGFLSGLPQESHIQHYFHAKYTTARTGIVSRETASGEGQNIFTRPASSAVFAFVGVIDLAGLGFDDAADDYAVKDEYERRERKQAVIDAMSYTLMRQHGANTSQQFPHIMDFEGAIVTSASRCPAPTVSAMREDYKATLRKLCQTANRMTDGEPVTCYETSSLADTVDLLTTLAHDDQSPTSKSAYGYDA